jgi:hypothetical protein
MQAQVRVPASARGWARRCGLRRSMRVDRVGTTNAALRSDENTGSTPSSRMDAIGFGSSVGRLGVIDGDTLDLSSPVLLGKVPLHYGQSTI